MSRPMLGAGPGPTPWSAEAERAGASAGTASDSRVNRGVWVAAMTFGLPNLKMNMRSRVSPLVPCWVAWSRGRQLSTYRGKRDFAATPEPAGDARREAPTARALRDPGAPRARACTGTCAWSTTACSCPGPSPTACPRSPSDNRLAVRTEDHPLEYLDFHGEIPKGNYGAGTMTIWDRGTYEELKWEPRKIEVAPATASASRAATRCSRSAGRDPKDWMIHRMDPPADPAREPMPDTVVPMLARLGAAARATTTRWAFEIKWDGVRAIAHSEPGRLRLHSRNLNDITPRYPELRAAQPRAEPPPRDPRRRDRRLRRARAGRASARSSAACTSRPRRRCAALAASAPVDLHDLRPALARRPLAMDLPYEERRARLAELELTGDRWRTPDYVAGQGGPLLAATEQQGLEGVVAKRLDSPYEPGRRSRRVGEGQERSTARSSSSAAGCPGRAAAASASARCWSASDEDGRAALRRPGRHRLHRGELDRLARLLGAARARHVAVRRRPAGAAARRGVRRAAAVAEVEFTRVDAGRAAARTRPTRGCATTSRPTRSCASADRARPESVEDDGRACAGVDGRELKLSNLDKVLYPAGRLHQARRHRLLRARSRRCCCRTSRAGRSRSSATPTASTASSSTRRTRPSHRPDVGARRRACRPARKTIDYVVCDDRATLVWLGQPRRPRAAHVALARPTTSSRPTMLAFDLDPGEPATIVECCRGRRCCCEGMFDGLGLESFPKTSGSKGLQVYVPLNSPTHLRRHQAASPRRSPSCSSARSPSSSSRA